MTGKQEYEEKILRKINCTLDRNEKWLRSFYNFLGSNRTLETKYSYILCVSMFVEETEKKLSELDMDDFSEFINNLYQTKSCSYAIKTYAALKIFSKYLYAKEIISKDPMYYIERPKYKETKEIQEKREIGFLSKNEIKKYIETIQNGVGSSKAKAKQEKYKDRDILICLLFLTTGIRCSALMKIDVNDIDLENLTLSVYDKGDKINRYDLSEELIPFINKWIKVRSEILNKENETALFITGAKSRISQGGIALIVNKYASNIEGKHITPHKLRATYGTQVYAATHDIYYTQQCMKHNSPKTTELYIRGEVKSTKKASEIMGKLIK